MAEMNAIEPTNEKGKQNYEPPLLKKHGPLFDITAVFGSTGAQMQIDSNPSDLRPKPPEKWLF